MSGVIWGDHWVTCMGMVRRYGPACMVEGIGCAICRTGYGQIDMTNHPAIDRVVSRPPGDATRL